ncbi:MAG: NfeD family protein [Planctomycetota bacterium]|jgi:membrane-bound serine protease (ClpP class)
MIWWAVALLLLAFLLIFLELMIPSFGMIALASLFCFTGAVVLAFMESTVAGFVFVGVVVVGIPTALYFAAKVFRYSPIGRRMILGGPSQDMRGGGAGIGDMEALLGREGVTHTKLRPAGIAIIGGKRVDVVAEGAMVEAGVPVRVQKVEGNRVVVRKMEK